MHICYYLNLYTFTCIFHICTLQFLIPLVLIFVYGMMWGSGFALFQMESQLFQQHLQTRQLFSH